MITGDQWRPQRPLDALCHHQDLLLTHQSLNEGSELIAAEPGDAVLVSHRCAQARSHLGEYEIARVMSPGVVDGFEVIEIHKQNPDRAMLARRASQGIVQAVKEGGPAQHARKRIM